MKKTLEQIIKNAILAVAVIAALGTAQPAKAEGEWVDVTHIYKTTERMPSTRVEAGCTAGGVNYYGFVDYENNELFGKVRAIKPIGNGFGLSAEYTGGTSAESCVRTGITYEPKLGTDNYTRIKVYPFETTGHNGPQIGLYMSQKIRQDAKISILADYNTQNKTLYIEGDLAKQIGKCVYLTAGFRGYGPTDGTIQVSPHVGFKVNVKF